MTANPDARVLLIATPAHHEIFKHLMLVISDAKGFLLRWAMLRQANKHSVYAHRTPLSECPAHLRVGSVNISDLVLAHGRQYIDDDAHFSCFVWCLVE